MTWSEYELDLFFAECRLEGGYFGCDGAEDDGGGIEYIYSMDGLVSNDLMTASVYFYVSVSEEIVCAAEFEISAEF